MRLDGQAIFGLGMGAPHLMQFSFQTCSVPQYSHLTITVSGGGGGGNAVTSDRGRWTRLLLETNRAIPTTMIRMKMTKMKNGMKANEDSVPPI